MAKQNYSITIAIDDKHSVFHFYTMYENDKTAGNNKNTINHYKTSFSTNAYDNDFFEKFKIAVKQFVLDNPFEEVRKITVIVPDNSFLIDSVKVPTMKGMGQTRKALEVTLRGLYKNYNDLKVATTIRNQNKQYTTYLITVILKTIASSIYSACSENKMLVDTLTYSSNTLVSAAVTLNSKLKNGTYVLVDIKDIFTKYVLVCNGNVIGFYNLPFGMEELRRKRVIKEDLLFDHSASEIMVINSREKARAKKLTVMAMDAVYEDESLDDIEGYEEQDIQINEKTGDNVKTYIKKARKLPKFMLRETPTNAEGVTYENFRIFVKWALSLVESNKKNFEQNEVDSIYVNIPSDLHFVLEKANSEMENEIRFYPLIKDDTIDESIYNNLELYGSLFPKAMNNRGKL